jgi:Putative binding domain, N-terminal
MFVLVDLPFSCPWNALSDSSWITVIFPAFPEIARGDGPLRFIVQPNTTGVSRVGRIAVAEKVLMVFQPAQ